MNENNKISITFDATTSAGYHPYISTTVHYMSNDWTIHEDCISCEHFDPPHTANNTQSKISTILIENGINMTNLFSYTVDCGSNNKIFVNQVQSNSIFHIQCFGHRLNTLILHFAKKNNHLSEMVKKIKNVTLRITGSTINRKELLRVQKDRNTPLLPILYPDTRWCYIAGVMKRILEIVEYIKKWKLKI
jgi:hypothetical protein